MMMNAKNILFWTLGVAIIGAIGFFSAKLFFAERPETSPVVETVKETKFSVAGKISAVSENSITVESERGAETFSLDGSVAVIGESGSGADKSYLVPGVSVSVSGRDGRLVEIKATSLPEIIISRPVAFSPVGLSFTLAGFYKTSADEIAVRLTNRRTNAVYLDKKLAPKNKASYYEPLSLEVNLKTAFDILDKDNLLLTVDSRAGKEDRSLVFGAGLTPKIKVPFLRGSACASVVEADRLISASRSSVRSAIEEMIAGPVDAEKESGLRSAFPPETKIRALKFDNTAVSIDFSKELLSASGSTCSSSGLKAQLSAVLKQFPTVASYEFKIDGKDWYGSKQ